MADKVKFNLKNVHYALQTVSTTGEIGYSTPVPIKGAVSTELSPKGNTYTFYADGIEYYKTDTNGGYDGTLEVANLPESFYKDVLNEELDDNKNLVEKTGAQLVKFALGFQVDGDEKGSKFWFYGGTCTRPNVKGKTNEEGVEVQTDTLNVSFAPEMDGNVKIKSTSETSTSVLDGWFTAVVMPAPATV